MRQFELEYCDYTVERAGQETSIYLHGYLQSADSLEHCFMVRTTLGGFCSPILLDSSVEQEVKLTLEDRSYLGISFKLAHIGDVLRAALEDKCITTKWAQQYVEDFKAQRTKEVKALREAVQTLKESASVSRRNFRSEVDRIRAKSSHTIELLSNNLKQGEKVNARRMREYENNLTRILEYLELADTWITQPEVEQLVTQKSVPCGSTKAYDTLRTLQHHGLAVAAKDKVEQWVLAIDSWDCEPCAVVVRSVQGLKTKMTYLSPCFNSKAEAAKALKDITHDALMEMFHYFAGTEYENNQRNRI